MPTCFRNKGRLAGIVLDLLLGLFVVGLCVMMWLPLQAGAKSEGDAGDASEAPSVSVVRPRGSLGALQGTPIVATITGSIDGTETTFIGQRHLRSGLRGDRNCALFGTIGARHYDEFTFLNNSSSSQRVSIAFTSGCGGNTFMAAYSPQFDPSSICANFIASPGSSSSIDWDFTVCGSSQFSIVVYGLEPGVTCGKYSFTVFANNIVFVGGPTLAQGAPGGKDGLVTSMPNTDVVLKKHKHKLPGTDTKLERILPNGAPWPASGLLAAEGTPLVAAISDSHSAADPVFIGPRHFLSGIPGDGNCVLTGPIVSHFYDEVFFQNNSPNIETVQIQPTGGCVSSSGPRMVIAAYSGQFNPNNICDGLIAVSSFPTGGNWSFRVCPNTRFSIVVYSVLPGVTCSSYSYNVFAASTEVILIGGATDLSVSKTGPAGPVSVGSNIVYNITFANNGPTVAGGVVFTDPLPNGLNFISLNLLSNLGTALPPPVCTTPPVGSPGTVSCSMNLLGVPGTALINSITYALTVNVSAAAGSSVVNTAFVSYSGQDLNPNNNSSSVTTTIAPPFNLCLQDDSSRSILQFNSSTGDYLFSSCQGVTLSGRGTITVKGSVVTLQDSTSDRRVLARIDSSVLKGTATVQLFSPARLFTITDRNTADNTCGCS